MGILNNLFGITECGSVHGELVDGMLELVHWFMAALGIGWTIFLIYVFYRFNRRRNARASYAGVQSHASSHIEVGVIIVEIILLLGFAFPLWGQRVDDIPVNSDVQVRAIAQQYNWTFHYAGADGRFGNTSPFFYSSGNIAGIDPEDPNGKDDIVASELWAPLNKSVVVGVTSKDVIHNLALVRVRVATDANPGSMNRVWFVPTIAGKSEIICGQLCGAGHGVMKGLMNIVSEKEYADWLKEQNTFGASSAPAAAPAPAAPAATATPAAAIQ
ncbi:MAG: cytochrome c oxidase subunit II [Verrucomicrobiaceae bacterium]